MTAAPLFVDFARVVLDRREREGIRGIYHERNRFSVHVEGAAFAAMPLDAIRPRDLRAWIREMQDKIAQGTDHTLADDTVKRAFSLVSSVFTVAIEDDILEMDPSHAVKVKKRVTERSTREKWTVLSLDEQKLLAKCDAIPVADRLAIRFAVATGLRQGEQFALELRDLHLGVESPHVYVRFGKPGLPPKSGKTRRVPLMADGLVAAKEWSYLLGDFAPSNPHSLVFPTPRGGRRSVGKPLGGGGRFKQHLAMIGVTRRVRWHDLRHTFCSNLVTGVLGRRWSLEEIRPLAGHSSITITERYSHMDERELARAAGETAFSHGPAIADCEASPDTERDVAAWDGFDENDLQAVAS
jgi:integrase